MCYVVYSVIMFTPAPNVTVNLAALYGEDEGGDIAKGLSPCKYYLVSESC